MSSPVAGAPIVLNSTYEARDLLLGSVRNFETKMNVAVDLGAVDGLMLKSPAYFARHGGTVHVNGHHFDEEVSNILNQVYVYKSQPGHNVVSISDADIAQAWGFILCRYLFWFCD
ncbi:MAG TPA: hypothetical protein VNU97_13175 [Rhizomicrobium sp.]|jgi:hypothetical protein|nr:hypothetical protein [Rhizomicrobium sp.]